jgi:replicative DNA helicase
MDKKKKILKTREIPHNLEAEETVLGCVMYDAQVAPEILSALTRDDFYSESLALIFDAMKAIHNENRPVDLVTMQDRLSTSGGINKIGGVPYLTQIQLGVPSAANYKYYLEIVKRDSTMRKMVRACAEIIDLAHSNATQEEVIKLAEKSVFDIGRGTETSSLVHISEPMLEVMGQLYDRSAGIEKEKGLATGYDGIDEVLNGGFHKGDLIILAARPSVGKSALMMNIVENVVLRDGKSCAVFSLEMSKKQLVERLISSEAEVSLYALNNNGIKDVEWEGIHKLNGKIGKTNLFIDDSSIVTAGTILSKCRRLKAMRGLDLVAVDYLQLMENGAKTKDANRQQDISEISRALKIAAKELNVPILALSQLSRAVESRESQKPRLADLRDSGAIEQDADVVMFIYRPDLAEKNSEKVKSGDIVKGRAEILIEKNRQGKAGVSVPLNWGDGKFMKFKNVEE